jgi:hypothetical protein
VISDDLLAHHLGVYELAGAKHLIDDWKSSFRCADVLVFPSYALKVTDLIISSNDVWYDAFAVFNKSIVRWVEYVTVFTIH